MPIVRRDRDRVNPLLQAFFQRIGQVDVEGGQAKGLPASVWDAGNQVWATKAVPYYQEVPKDAAYPYIVLGNVVELPFNTKTALGSDITITMGVVSQYLGHQELGNIAGALLDSVTSGDLDLSASGLRVVMLRPMPSGGGAGSEELADGRTKVRRVPFRVKLQDVEP